MVRKVKYSYEFKLSCVKEVLEKHRSMNSVAFKHGFGRSNLRKWLDFYNKYGAVSLEPRCNQVYPFTFKLEVLLSMEQKCLSLSEACLFFNIPTASVIISWQKRFEKYGNSGLEDKPKGRPKSMWSCYI